MQVVIFFIFFKRPIIQLVLSIGGKLPIFVTGIRRLTSDFFLIKKYISKNKTLFFVIKFLMNNLNLNI